MKLLDYTGLQRIVENFKKIFSSKDYFDNNLEKIFWIELDFLPEQYSTFDIQRYFIDGMTINNTEVIMEMTSYQYGGAYRVMDTMRLPVTEVMGISEHTVLKVGWFPIPHQGDWDSGVVIITIRNGIVSATMLGGFPPVIRFYLRKFMR